MKEQKHPKSHPQNEIRDVARARAPVLKSCRILQENPTGFFVPILHKYKKRVEFYIGDFFYQFNTSRKNLYKSTYAFTLPSPTSN